MLFAGALYGDRRVDVFLDDAQGNEHAAKVSVHGLPGSCYIAGMSTAEHQVVHELTPGVERPLLPPLEGPVEVAFVVRCTLFRHEKARNCNGLEGRKLYKPLQEALCKWFADSASSLRLPSLEECRLSYGRTRLRTKRPLQETMASEGDPQFHRDHKGGN